MTAWAALWFALALWETQLALWGAIRNNRTKHRICAAAASFCLFIAIWSLTL